MRPLHLETESIEQYLIGQTPQMADFELQMMLDNSLRERVELQKEAYKLIKTYGRAQLCVELDNLHTELERTQPEWLKQIKRLFTGKS